MEVSIIAAFVIIFAVCIVVAIDQTQQDANYILGEEWDFTLPNSYKKS